MENLKNIIRIVAIIIGVFVMIGIVGIAARAAYDRPIILELPVGIFCLIYALYSLMDSDSWLRKKLKK